MTYNIDTIKKGATQSCKGDLNMKTYMHNDYSPYGSGEMFYLDCFVDDDFCGNVTEQLIKNGAEFKVIDNENAKLTYKGETVSFVKRG